jgi:hypothetical protein
MSMLPCPFCGGNATLERQLNMDKLHVDHTSDCPIRLVMFERWHYNGELKPVQENPFQHWNKRAALQVTP